MVSKFQRILLVGDIPGIPMLLDFVPITHVAGIVASSIRPQYLEELRELAQELNKPFLVQPKRSSVNYGAFIESLVNIQCDGLLCNSYAMKLGEDILQAVQGNALNLHAALLPKNRGPNPIQWAIIKGETETGVTLHYMVDAIDAGDIYAQRKVPIFQEDTWVTTSEKVVKEMEVLLDEAIPKLLRGEGKRISQQETEATVNVRLTPDSPRIDFDTMSDRDIFNWIRAQVKPLAGAYLMYQGERIVFDTYIPLEEIAMLRERYGNHSYQNLCHTST